MISLTPLSAPADGKSGPLAVEPICYLLQLDDVRILLDLGGHDPRITSEPGYSASYEQRVKECVGSLFWQLSRHV